MARVTRSFDVQADQQSVVAYLRDFAHTEEWDPGTVRCAPTSSGPVGLGSTWRNVSKFLGRETELDYELTTDEPDHLVFTGSNRTATSVDDLTITAGAGSSGTSLTYRATVTLKGWARITDPIVQLAFNRIADHTAVQLARTLERRAR